ncbi:MAG: fatty acid oxidation complex subunit alpha FadJ [Acidimicrobiia bacterium]|nr:fatty acid oxidation complex subunit alpha FadJ [Acidimicrobiia bacterium]
MTTTAPDLELTHFEYSVDDDGVALVLIDRDGEAMNTMSPDLMMDADSVIERIENDPDVVAVVLGSAKPDNFLAGADIRWFQSLTDAETAAEMLTQGQEVINRLENLHKERGKPVVAAIHGPCLGGGMELALACSMRIASDDEGKTQLGQPEVQLGLLPGAGGTQRLPRLVGVATALDLVLTGRPVRPRKARKMGLVDEVCPVEVLLDVARRRALDAVGTLGSEPGDGAVAGLKGLLSPERIQQLALEENPLGRKVLFQKAEQQMLETTKGNYPAPKEILQAVKVGMEQGLEAGLAFEAEAFGRLVVTPESKALRSVFFASQDLKKETWVPDGVEPVTVRKVGVIGGGLMGGGIATVTATKANTSTRIKEVDDAGAARGLGYVDTYLRGQVKRRRMTPREAERVMHLVTGTVDYAGFGNVDLVIEAVFEDLALKHAILADVEAATDEATIFATNTSSIPIADIAAAAKRPENVIGMHYFSPADKMPLLEIITTDRTADRVTATCVEFGKRQGKTVIVVNDGTGFYANRALAPYMNEVGYLLAEGVDIEHIDDTMVQWGFPVGPVTLIDEVGIDVAVKVGEIMVGAFGDRMTPAEGLDKMIADDRMGRKNERGFYRYEKGKKTEVDESVYSVLGVTPSTSMPTGEIEDRLSLQFINEAARCLEDGVLRSARDGDIGAIFGFGFPPFTGGPFMLVDRLGAAEVVKRMERLAETHGDRFQPAQILVDHAESGEPVRR